MKNEELFIGCVFLIIICVLWEIYNTSRLTTYLKQQQKELENLKLLDASNKWKNDHVFQECKNEVGETLEKYLNSVKTNSCDQQIKDLKKIYS